MPSKSHILYGLVATLFLLSISHAQDVDACGMLDQADTTYTLIGNIDTTGETCLTVGDVNIEIDCAGYYIHGDNTTDTYGIYTDQTGGNFHDCNISGFEDAINIAGNNNVVNRTNASSYYAAGEGIHIILATGNVIDNSIINSTTATGNGILFNTNCDDGKVLNTVSSGGSRGIYAQSSDDVEIEGSTAISTSTESSASAIYIASSLRPTINNTDTYNLGGVGRCLHISNTDYGTFTNLAQEAVSGCCAQGTELASGSDYNNLSNFSINTPLSTGLYLTDSSNNIIEDFTIDTDANGYSIYLNDAHNNVIENSTVNGSSGIGTYLSRAINNSLRNLTSHSIGNAGFYLNQGDNNTLDNCTGIAYGGGHGFYLNDDTGTNITDSVGKNDGGAGYGIRLYDNEHGTVENTLGNAGSGKGISIETNSKYNNITNCTGNSSSSYGIYIYNGADYNNITDSQGMSDSSQAIRIENSDSNTIRNSSATGGVIGLTIHTSDNTIVIGSSIYADSTHAALLLVIAYNSTIANSTINGSGVEAIGTYTTTSSTNNLFINNTLISDTDLVSINAQSGNNTFYWNNFTDTTGYYVNDANGTNYYNTTMSGHGEGNIWHNVMNGSVEIFGIYPAIIAGHFYGYTGSGHPYNSTNSLGKVTSGVVDWGAITPNEYTSPNCTLVSITPSDLLANSTGLFEAIINCSCSVGCNISRFAVSRTVEGFTHAGLPNLWSARPPENDKAGNYTCVHYDIPQILRADGRGDNKWYDGYGIYNGDNFSYSVQGNDSVLVTITNGSDWAQMNLTWKVEPAAFRSIVPLSRGHMERENKTGQEHEIYLNNGLLFTSRDIEAYRNTSNYTITAFYNMNYSGSPNKDLELYYCNSSYNTTGGTAPQDDMDNCVYAGGYDTADIDNRLYISRNSSYFQSTFSVVDKQIGGITATPIMYNYFRSRVPPALGKYLFRYANGSSGTNVSFNESDIAWGSTDDGDTMAQASFTPDQWAAMIKEGDEFQLGIYIEDTNGVNYTNLTLVKDEIGDTNHSISSPNIGWYNSTYGGFDENLNGTHGGMMYVRVLTALDPDGVGTVNHSLYLANTDGTINYTINSSFHSADDCDVTITFNTTLVAEGIYKMNITATADDDANDTKSLLTVANFNISQETYFINWAANMSADGQFVFADWLGYWFNQSAQPAMIFDNVTAWLYDVNNSTIKSVTDTNNNTQFINITSITPARYYADVCLYTSAGVKCAGQREINMLGSDLVNEEKEQQGLGTWVAFIGLWGVAGWLVINSSRGKRD